MKNNRHSNNPIVCNCPFCTSCAAAAASKTKTHSEKAPDAGCRMWDITFVISDATRTNTFELGALIKGDLDWSAAVDEAQKLIVDSYGVRKPGEFVVEVRVNRASFPAKAKSGDKRPGPVPFTPVEAATLERIFRETSRPWRPTALDVRGFEDQFASGYQPRGMYGVFCRRCNSVLPLVNYGDGLCVCDACGWTTSL